MPTDPLLDRLLLTETKLREATLDVYASLGLTNLRDLSFQVADYGTPGYSGAIAPPWYQQNQKFGEAIPVYRTEVELRNMRDKSRILCATNEFAICAIENRQNYVIGDGFKYSAAPKQPHNKAHVYSAACVQAVIDGWAEINNVSDMEAEALLRLDVEGEFFIRGFKDRSGWVHQRFIEPEHVTAPGSNTDDPENSFGVCTDRDDTCTVHGYHVVEDPQEHSTDTKYVDQSKIIHAKLNARQSWKRGLPTFYPVEGNLRRCEDLLASMSSMAKARAKIALIRKITGLTTPTANSLLSRLTSIQATDPASNETLNIERLRYGTVLTASANTDYEMPAVQLGASDIVEVLQAELRAVASRLQMPEWMFTALADAKYSNAFVVEAPTLKSFRRLQRVLRNAFGCSRYGHRRSLLWRQLHIAVEAGMLCEDDLHNVNITCEGPTLEARDRMQEVTRHKELVAGGFESKETAQRLLELDPDVESPLIAREQIGKARPVTDASAVMQIQTAYIAGQLPRPAAAANLQILLGFTHEQAELLLPLATGVNRAGQAGSGGDPGAGDPGGAGAGAPGDAGGSPGQDAPPGVGADAGGSAGGGGDTGDSGGAGSPDASDKLIADAMAALGVSEQLREAKSGVFTDAAGHRYRLDNGKRVPLGESKPGAGKGAASKTPAADTQGKAQGDDGAKQLEDMLQYQKTAKRDKAASVGKAIASRAPVHGAVQSIGEHIDAADIDPTLKTKYKNVLRFVCHDIPPAAMDRIAKNIKGAKFYNSTNDVACALLNDQLKKYETAAADATAKGMKGTVKALAGAIEDVKRNLSHVDRGWGGAIGAYDSNTGTLHLDGSADPDILASSSKIFRGVNTAEHTYAHELTHALDGMSQDRHSYSPEWKAAFTDEINTEDTPLSRYAKTSAVEGFAEFGRLLYTRSLPLATIREKFPKASAFFESIGAWPEHGQ